MLFAMAIFVMPLFSHAETIVYHQWNLNDAVGYATNNGSTTQQLGNSLSGTVTDVWLAFYDASSQTIEVDILDCNSSYAGCSVVASTTPQLFYGITSGISCNPGDCTDFTQAPWTISGNTNKADFKTPLTFISGHYYMLNVFTGSPVLNMQPYCGSDASWPNYSYCNSHPKGQMFAFGYTPTQPQISFVLPNASGTSPDFQNWLLNVSTTASSTYGNVKVWYGQSSSSYDFSDQAQFSTFVSANPFPLPKSQLLNPIVSFFSTSTWYAMAEYYGSGFDVTSTQIQFHINPNAAVPNTSSSALVGYISPLPFTNPSSTGSSSLPYADCGITQIGGCLTNAGLFLANFFFQPNPQVIQSMNANFDHIKGSFPFSAFFNVIDTAKANATTTSGNYDLYLTIPATGQKIPILTSTTLEMAIGSSSKAIVFTTEKNIIWLGTGIAMLSLLLL